MKFNFKSKIIILISEFVIKTTVDELWLEIILLITVIISVIMYTVIM